MTLTNKLNIGFHANRMERKHGSNAPMSAETAREQVAASPGGATAAGALPEWNLNDLYPGMDSAEFRADLAWVRDEAPRYETRHRGKLAALLASDPAAVGRAIAEFEAVEEKVGRIMSYAGLLHAANSDDPARTKFLGDAQDKMTAASSHLLFLQLELNELSQDALRAGYEKAPELAHYRPWLDDLRKEKPHQLDERSERLFHEKSVTGASAWNRLFDETMSSLRFAVDGEELSLEPALNLLQHPDREKRRSGGAEISRVLASNLRLFTLLTNTLAKDKQISDDWRNFANPAAARHLSNRVEPEVVDAMVVAVRQSYPLLSHRYYRLKAKWLGLGKLSYFDRNAPMPQAGEMRYEWQQAQDTVLEAFAGFAPEMAEIAGRFFDRGWIDASARPGKAPGAFAHPTVPSVHPYVLVNFLGKPRDVMTLAHELGHGVHQVLAAAQGPLMSQTPLTLAETASVFGEMLTFRSMLAKTDDPAQRKAMLSRKIEDMLNTVVRQIAFFSFEELVHRERRDGELTSDRLGELWMKVQRESLGDAFELADEYAVWWSYIPHFIHSPFYVYAYAFGDCLVNSLFAVYQSAQEGFQQRYFEMLKAGGTRHHKELLAPFGLDAGQPEFWQRGLSLISSLIDEVEALA